MIELVVNRPDVLSLPSRDTDLVVDTRESVEIRRIWYLLQEDHKDLNIRFEACPVGDYNNPFLCIEFKHLSDFVSSFTEVIIRKDGTRYNRLDSQINRMLELDKPYKMLMIIGNMEDLISGINRNSIRGMIASIYAKGIDVMWLQSDENYVDQIMRIHFKTLKYAKGIV